MSAQPKATGGESQRLVSKAVAVVVQTVALFYADTLKGIANLEHAAKALGNRVQAHPLPATGGPQLLVSKPVTVVVHPVALFRSQCMNIRVHGRTVGVVRIPVVVIVEVYAILDPIRIEVGIALVDSQIAVVVRAVAGLISTGKHGWIERFAVERILDSVPILVIFTRVPYSVPIGIRLLAIGHYRTVIFGIRHAITVKIIVARVAISVPVGVQLESVIHAGAVVYRVRNRIAVGIIITRVPDAISVQVLLPLVDDGDTVVVAVQDTISVGIVVHAVGGSVAVGVVVTLIDGVVAVVVLAVAQFRCRRIGQRVQGSAVDRIIGSIIIVVAVYTVFVAVVVAVDVGLIHDEIAVVVLAVAQFLGTHVNFRVEGSTVVFVRSTVAIIVHIALVTEIVEVKVLLRGVEIGGAVVLDVGEPVAVDIRLEAIGNAVAVGILKAFIDETVAVVVFSIAGFRMGVCPHAFQLSIVALEGARARPELVGHEAGLAARVLVDLTVTILVETVTRLRRRNRG